MGLLMGKIGWTTSTTATQESPSLTSVVPARRRMPLQGAPTLSALVVAHDEEKRLPACLASLAFADEIVVTLDRCRDQSAAVAQRAGARIVAGGWELEGPRRNAGIAACRGAWILEVDADERVTPALAAEIRTAIATAEDGYFLIPLANHIGERRVRFGWGAYNGPAAKACLFKAGGKDWGAGRVHPKIALRGARQQLREPLLHYIYRDYTDMIARLNRYTELAARDALDRGQSLRLRDAFRCIFSRAWKSYIARRGYREGVDGIALALASALYPMLVYLKWAELSAAGRPCPALRRGDSP
ncbi:MAG TPA: glycosyltransferase family 2 protein [Stellaceae bacterium]|nr:glycosyltransferase family 2 protein [Stellaceae bacterium]